MLALLLPAFFGCPLLSGDDLVARLGEVDSDSGKVDGSDYTGDTSDISETGEPTDSADSGDVLPSGDSADSGEPTDTSDSEEPTDTSEPGCAAVVFDATSDAVSFPNDAALKLGASWTIEMWIYPSGESGGLYTKGTGTSPITSVEMQYFGLSGGAPYAYFANGSAGASSLFATKSVTAGAWNHVAWVANDDVLTIFVGGKSSGSTNTETDATDGSGEASIGYHSSLAATAVNGYVSDVRISNYARYTSSFSPATSLSADGSSVAFWPLDEGSGDTVTDASGRADGTLAGAEWVMAPCRGP